MQRGGVDASDSDSFDLLARSNVNSLWGAFAVEVLARLGVRTVVSSPGSRSTPLTVAAARNPRLETLSFLDERSAAFFALGVSKQTGVPAALICTSGTAAANYFPAVVEASESGTPLLILTADRPPELRACSSGQTIDQIKLFGAYVREFREVALPEAEPAMLRYLRQTLVHAVARAGGENPGPVHLNFPFRDPLAPQTGVEPVIGRDVPAALAAVLTRPVEAVSAGAGIDAVAVERLSSHRRGLIMVGALRPREGDESFADAVALISRKLGWPVLADVLNPLRAHAGELPGLIGGYDCILRDAGVQDSLRPTSVLQIGIPPTSKVLRGWLEGLDAATFLLGDRPLNTDPLHRTAVPLIGEAHLLAEVLEHQKPDAGWMDAWVASERGVQARLDGAMDAMDELFEGKAAWLLSRHLPVGTPVFLANSMTVRYAESFWQAGSRAYRLLGNRGANGIDGTLGTAMGVAHGAKPAVLLTGDLAFLHDANALLGAGALKGSLTVVVMNNRGGGIFEYLPIAEREALFEPLFATPQSVEIGDLCRAYRVAHRRLSRWGDFQEAIGRLPASGVQVIELATDRKADVRTMRRIQAGMGG
ncbi:MAG: 2-succinyl-5-enolpyruvyl-6-hydroxy-3-cyclohexene-1-carboxylic-acid synthase, partial [Opitutales bacterium]